jgi:hypothetical protein
MGMDYHHDPDMVLPPGRTGTNEVCVIVLCFVILIDIIDYICIWMLTLSLVFFCICGTRG